MSWTVTPVEVPNRLRALTVAVREEAAGLEGVGEDPGRNNRGTGVDRLREIAGVGRVGGGGAWCAVAASAAIALACERLGLRPPAPLSAGAKSLVRAYGRAGHHVVPSQRWTRWGRYRRAVDPEAMRWALLILWHRGRERSWQRHVEIVDSYDAETDTLTTWAGNVAPTGLDLARLQSLGHEVEPGQAVIHLRTHPSGRWRRRLDAIVGIFGSR